MPCFVGAAAVEGFYLSSLEYLGIADGQWSCWLMVSPLYVACSLELAMGEEGA